MRYLRYILVFAQIEKFPTFVERRRHNFDRLRAALAETEDRLILPVPAENSRPSWFGFLITCKEGTDRNKLVQYIESKGIQTRMLFAGNLIKHPCFDEMRAEKKGYRVVGTLENTDRIMSDTFWVGVYPGISASRDPALSCRPACSQGECDHRANRTRAGNSKKNRTIIEGIQAESGISASFGARSRDSDPG